MNSPSHYLIGQHSLETIQGQEEKLFGSLLHAKEQHHRMKRLLKDIHDISRTIFEHDTHESENAEAEEEAFSHSLKKQLEDYLTLHLNASEVHIQQLEKILESSSTMGEDLSPELWSEIETAENNMHTITTAFEELLYKYYSTHLSEERCAALTKNHSAHHAEESLSIVQDLHEEKKKLTSPNPPLSSFGSDIEKDLFEAVDKILHENEEYKKKNELLLATSEKLEKNIKEYKSTIHDLLASETYVRKERLGEEFEEWKTLYALMHNNNLLTRNEEEIFAISMERMERSVSQHKEMPLDYKDFRKNRLRLLKELHIRLLERKNALHIKPEEIVEQIDSVPPSSISFNKQRSHTWKKVAGLLATVVAASTLTTTSSKTDEMKKSSPEKKTILTSYTAPLKQPLSTEKVKMANPRVGEVASFKNDSLLKAQGPFALKGTIGSYTKDKIVYTNENIESLKKKNPHLQSFLEKKSIAKIQPVGVFETKNGLQKVEGAIYKGRNGHMSVSSPTNEYTPMSFLLEVEETSGVKTHFGIGSMPKVKVQAPSPDIIEKELSSEAPPTHWDQEAHKVTPPPLESIKKPPLEKLKNFFSRGAEKLKKTFGFQA